MKGNTISENNFEVKRGNLSIRGIEYRSEGTNLPIVIVCHGFLATYRTTKHYAKQFAKWGYAAYCFDFIGGGIGSKSDGKLDEMSVMTEKEDLNSVINYVCELPYTNSEELILMGCSQGGFVSAMVASELKEKIKKLILLYPALCIPDDARKGKMMVFKFDPMNIPKTISFGPLKLGGLYAKAVVDIDPYEEISGYEGDVLILHGLKDKIVDSSYAQRAYKTYGRKCSLSFLPNAGHGFKKRDDKYAFYAIKQFLEGKKELLAIDIKLKGIRFLPKDSYRKTAIPFDGKADGNLFSGIVMSGAEDVQMWKGLGIAGCKADYILSGKDYTGTECTIHVVNTSKDGRNWTPNLETNSKALSFLNGQKLDAVFKLRPKGPFIRIFGSSEENSSSKE